MEGSRGLPFPYGPMCGRYSLTNPARLDTLPLRLAPGAVLPPLTPRYNVAPSQPVPLLRRAADTREVALVRWGLIPGWADDPSIGNRLANARGDTVAVKPSFRSAFKHRRGILLADGFYEWQVVPGQKGKQPWWIGLPDEAPFGMAAIWERWGPKPATATAEPGSRATGAGGGAPIESACLITTEPNGVMAPIHDRMPVILDPADYETWLNLGTPVPILQALLRPYPGWMRARRVSTYVNAPKNNGPACVAPVTV